MTARTIDQGEMLDARPGEIVVAVTGDDGAPRDRTLRSVEAHLPSGVPVWTGDGDAGGRAAVVAAAAPADVVLVSAGCMVGPGWLERLRAAGERDPGVATVSALCAAWLKPGAGGGEDVEPGVIDAAAGPLHPRLPAAAGPCVLVRRSAIELAAAAAPPPDPAFSTACVRRGLAHLLADDVLVTTVGPGPDAPSDPDEPGGGPVARSLGMARRALHGLTVVIDARILAGPPDGTRRHVQELITAVARTGAIRVTALVPAGLDAGVRERLAALPDVSVVALGPSGAVPAGVHGDLVHRPHQVSAPADLAVLAGLADRLVVTHQDLISFHAPGYFPSRAGWEGYRELTRRALRAADHVLFFSEQVRADALAEDLAEPGRATVVRIGADHAGPVTVAPPSPPAGGAGLAPDGEVMLCLGTDFLHKNRVFALRIAAELQRRHGWTGRLVLAGPSVAHGSSRREEAQLLAADPALAEAVLTLGAVSEAEKEWLLARAAVVLYPTVHEGFGLIPYEAAAHGRPCLWAPGTALAELLPDTAAALVPWDAAASADGALALMRDPAARVANVEAVRAAGAALRWEETGRRLVEVYGAVCDGPPAPTAVLERAGGVMRGGVSEDAMRLVGPDGILARDLERPLLALLTRPRLARPLGAVLRAGYRVSRRRLNHARC